MVHRSKEHVDAIYGFRQKSAPAIRKEVEWLLEKDRFTCPALVREVCRPAPGLPNESTDRII